MIHLETSEIWLVWDSQHLSEAGARQKIVEHAHTIASALSRSEVVSLKVVCMPPATTPQDVSKICSDAGTSSMCAGVILWMKDLAPSEAWIHGLDRLHKPCLMLHTQFTVEASPHIDDRTFVEPAGSLRGGPSLGWVPTRMRTCPKVVVGHWSDPEVKERVATWVRAARAWHDLQGARLCLFGDDIRSDAFLLNCKLDVERCFGSSLRGYDLDRLEEAVKSVGEAEVSTALRWYTERYDVDPELARGGANHMSLRSAIRQEIGMHFILEDNRYKAFTTPIATPGQKQLSSFACQRLMAAGYGFARDGDGLIAALVRAMKVMGEGLHGGTTFMEPHMQDLSPHQERALGSRSLEVCETISARTPAARIRSSNMGGDADPVRFVFNAIAGSASIASLVDLGDRFRLVVGEITAIEPSLLPNSRAARAMWTCKPDYKTARASWILAGGSGRTAYSNSVTAEMLKDFARLAGIEVVTIDRGTDLVSLEEQLRIGECWYRSTRRTIA